MEVVKISHRTVKKYSVSIKGKSGSANVLF